MSIAVKSGVEELDRERMRVCRKTSRTIPFQRRRYATREFRRTVSIVIAIVYRESDAIRHAERDWRELVRVGELIRRKDLDSTFSRRAA